MPAALGFAEIKGEMNTLGFAEIKGVGLCLPNFLPGQFLSHCLCNPVLLSLHHRIILITMLVPCPSSVQIDYSIVPPHIALHFLFHQNSINLPL
jgi:hypothetical protein